MIVKIWNHSINYSQKVFVTYRSFLLSDIRITYLCALKIVGQLNDCFVDEYYFVVGLSIKTCWPLRSLIWSCLYAKDNCAFGKKVWSIMNRYSSTTVSFMWFPNGQRGCVLETHYLISHPKCLFVPIKH